MAEILADGYQSLIEFVVSSEPVPPEWDHLAIYDDTQTEITRLEISSDARAEWVDIDGDPIISVEVLVRATDSDISYPETLQYSAIFDDTTANSGRQITTLEQFPLTEFNQKGDKMTFTHTVEVPQQS